MNNDLRKLVQRCEDPTSDLGVKYCRRVNFHLSLFPQPINFLFIFCLYFPFIIIYFDNKTLTLGIESLTCKIQQHGFVLLLVFCRINQ
jgi:hypothetical protein